MMDVLFDMGFPLEHIEKVIKIFKKELNNSTLIRH
jgi:hypothetical protein